MVTRITLRDLEPIEVNGVEVPINPFQYLRVKHHMTHAELAKAMYISKQALIRLEQGTYDVPLPAALNYWTGVHEVSELSIVDAYENFQQEMRRAHVMLFGPDLKVDAERVFHPLGQLRKRAKFGELNQTELAKVLCIGQSTIQRWENYWQQQKTVPRALQQVFVEIGYTNDQVVEFNNLYKQWRAWRADKANVKLVR